jgi:hypothetical protein
MNKFHFREIDWVIYFPSTGNKGRELNKYGVAYRDRLNNQTQLGHKINLEDALIQPIINYGYPHTIGLYQASTGRGRKWIPEYIENRVIQNKEQLLEWIAEIESGKNRGATI